MDEALRDALSRAARVPRLLVASDYDGTLSPIVEDPARAVPQPGAVTALAALAALPTTEVAVVSGRARRDLAAMAGLPSEIHLVGSHGAELDADLAGHLAPELADLRTRVRHELATLTAGRDGVRLEDKPASVTVHTRTAPRDVAAEVVAAVRSGPATWPGVHAMAGKEVIELSVLAPDKSAAVETLRARHAADAVVFLGDDVTDETVLIGLRAGDVGVKVGAGPTAAAHRVADPAAAVAALELLHDRRAVH
jgi:trehalose 6-phosphate phosphatase